MIHLRILFLLLFGPVICQAQTLPPREADFDMLAEGEGFRFKAQLPPPLQKAGAPPAFWSYYWEFGDGSFGTEPEPLHYYARPGEYEALLLATGHYDDGKAPNAKKKKKKTALAVNSLNNKVSNPFDTSKSAVCLRLNRAPRAGEALAGVLSYRNLGGLTTDGRLFLFFNEKKFPQALFRYDSARVHYGERPENLYSFLPCVPAFDWTAIPEHGVAGDGALMESEGPPAGAIIESMLAEARGKYREERGFRFQNLIPGEARNLFLAMQGLPTMLKDTGAMIHIEAIYAPFDPVIPPERFVLEIEIVGSHDPNAIAVSDNKVNYRRAGAKKLDYKVRFQNNGEGPASKIELTVEIPQGLRMEGVRPLQWYPECPICPDPIPETGCLDTVFAEKALVFTFYNVYLPGSRQKGVEVYDSTQGFVKYRLESSKNMPKRNFSSRAKIVFDKNKPIYTNYTRTRFAVGISPGIKAGYHYEPAETGQSYPFLGLSLSPYKSWRWYPQIEVLTGLKGRSEYGPIHIIVVDSIFTNPDFQQIERTDTTKTGTRGLVSVEIPLQMRRNFTSRFGIGFGASARLLWRNGEDIQSVHKETLRFINGMVDTKVEDFPAVRTPYKARSWQGALFMDLTFGSVRAGPNLGIRGGFRVGGAERRAFLQVSAEFKL